MKNKLLLFFCLTCAIGIKAQTVSICGEGIVNSQVANTITPTYQTSGNFCDKVFDRFGNQYNFEDIEVNTGGGVNTKVVSPSISCTAGYFKVFFANNSGMEIFSNTTHADRRAVICQVLKDLSGFINNSFYVPTPSVYVNILVDDISFYAPGTSTSAVLGIASSYYVAPLNPSSPNPGVVENQIYKTITSEQDAYYGVASPLNLLNTGSSSLYHGFMAFNFNNTSLVNWNDNMGIVCPATNFDLYTVALHEITHALGFASLISGSGVSKFGANNNYYSSYDKFLKDATNTPLVTSTSGCSSAYGLSFSSSTLYLGGNCSSSTPPNYSNCGAASKYVGSVNIPVYSPSCYESGSTLSHFEDMCYPTAYNLSNNDQYFTMSNATYNGTTKRFLQPEERLVLCDLGYNVSNTFTSTAVNAPKTYSTGACSRPKIYGINDGLVSGAYTYTTTSNTLTFSIVGGILANDAIIATNAICVETVYNTGTVSVSGNIITFSASPGFFGPVLLRYIPIDASSNQGNITYISGYIIPSSCNPVNPCNMVQNGNFEANVGCGEITPTNVAANCWNIYNSSVTPDLFVRGGCAGKPYANLGTSTYSSSPIFDSYSGSPNNSIMGLAGIVQTSSPYIHESIYNVLSTPLVPGQNYNLSFWAYEYSGSWKDQNLYTSLSNSLNVPMVVTLATYSSNIPPVGSIYYPTSNIDIVKTLTLAPSFNQWKKYTYTITYNPSNSQNGKLFFVGLDANQNSINVSNALGGAFSTYVSYVLFDDFEITPFSTGLALNNATICPSSVIPNLTTLSNQPSTVFSGPGVSFSSPNYIFTPPSSGNFVITGTYTNNIGCVYTQSATITVGSPSVTIAASSLSVCSNNTISLTAEGSIGTYTWLPNNVNTQSFVTTPTTTTTYTLINDVFGCTVSNTLTVVVYTISPLTITASPTIICVGGTSFINPSGGIGLYYIQPGNVFSTGFNVTPTITTTYTISGNSNPGSCPTSNTITVFVEEPFDININTTTNFVCSTVSAILTASPSGFTYTWSPPALVANSITVMPSVATIYTVIGTSTNNCTTKTNTILITPVDCACLTPAVNITFPYILPNYNPVISPFYAPYNITNDVQYGGVVTFSNCEVRVFPNVKWVVTSTGTLNIIGSHFYACGDMWKGIVVEPGGVLNIVPGGNRLQKTTLIEDAQVAVDIINYFNPPNPTNILTAKYVTFNKNNIGIRINGYRSNQTVYPFTIENCLFTSRDIAFSALTWDRTQLVKNSGSGNPPPMGAPYVDNVLYPPVGMKIPLAGLYPSNGIVLNNVGVTTGTSTIFRGIFIGNTTSNTLFNCFDNLREDITANSSNFTVVNSVFQTGQRFGRGGIASGGKAIVASAPSIADMAGNFQANIIAPTTNTNLNNSFYEKTACADITGYLSTNIKYCEAHSAFNTYGTLLQSNNYGNRGFNIKTNRYINISVENNKIYNIKNAILISLDNGFYDLNNQSGVGRLVGYISAEKNIIRNHKTTATGNEFVNIGISIADPFSTASTAFIPGNAVYTSANSNTLAFVHNAIDAKNISFSPVTINFNKIILQNEPNTFVALPTQIGINAVQLNKSVQIHQNNITGAVGSYSPGLKSISTGLNSLLSVRCNTTEATNRGIEFNNGQTVDAFEDNYLKNETYGLVLDNNAVLTSATTSVNVLGAPNRPTNNVWFGGWLTPGNFKTLTTGFSSAQNGKLYVDFSNPQLDPINTSTTTGIVGFEDYFHNGTSLSTLLNVTVPVAPSCRIGGGGNNPNGARSTLEALVTNIVPYTVDSNETRFINKTMAYRAILAEPTLKDSSTILANFYTTSQSNCMKGLCSIETTLMNDSLTTAQSKITAFAPSTAIETNYKNYYQIYLHTKDSSFTTADSTTLINLANACPYKDGGVVFQARALYNSIYEGYYKFTDACNTNNNSRIINNTNSLNNKENAVNVILKSKLYPNPNIGEFSIELTNKDLQTNVQICIFDNTGKQFIKEQRQVINGIVNCNYSLINGAYLVKVILQDGSVDIHRLIISK
ncbi:MAG: T9SS type A sorting domain-containing protein [Bacteroidota bacterium]|nr:T9SS type A sorting domain-containing protein [Bacteroidota bacterium]